MVAVVRSGRGVHARPGLRALALAAAAVLLAVPAPARADGGNAAWSVQPSSRTGPGNRPFFTYDLAPGGTVTDYVAVTNLGTTPLTVHVYASDAFTTATGGYDLLPAAQQPSDVGGWVRLGRQAVTVPARSRADIPFALTVPANATPGDHAGGIVAAVTSTTADATGATTRLEQRVGSRVYLRVTGELRPGLRVDDLSAGWSPGWTPFTGELTLRWTSRNTGNTRSAPEQSAEIEGLFGLPAGSVRLPAAPELLPGAAVVRTARISGRPALLRLSAAVTLTGADGTSARSTVTVWAYSWYYLTALPLAIGAVLLVRRLRRRA
ncbi:WxL protein peptidoglycan domain-containing protein [Actinoplanes sp. RD1]|uniref:WxL protein peptidoglycan domain-containing protein n=1 Tax=Actinoplanes sp. RD1 TaxID=3064538 RepID=UPI002742024D|nr:DUF916 domain-containing protein [Actinoplanes sp. RD1]